MGNQAYPEFMSKHSSVRNRSTFSSALVTSANVLDRYKFHLCIENKCEIIGQLSFYVKVSGLLVYVASREVLKMSTNPVTISVVTPPMMT